MADLEKFRGDDDRVDWDAYHKAQVAEGTRCMDCDAYMIFSGIFGGKPSGPRKCGQCRSVGNDEELDHDKYIRCPKCGEKQHVYDTEYYELLVENEHDVICPECDHEYEIVTHCEYSFTSPEMGEGG